MAPRLGLDKLCFYFGLLCYSLIPMSFAYYSHKVSLLFSTWWPIILSISHKNVRTTYEDVMLSCIFQLMHIMTSL